VTTLSDTWKFQLLPFDSRAAIEAAELIAKVKSEQRSQPWDTWAKVKFDVQITAIARAESATVIYSDDQDIENHGKRVKIPVVRICDLPLPSPPEPTPIEEGPVGSQLSFIDNLNPPRQITLESEVNDAATGTKTVADRGKSETNNKLQVDPTHPSAVQGSESGRAQGEAAGEAKGKDGEKER
jgi:hypothetical protein